VLRALRVAPEERFPSLRALGAALLPFASRRKRLMWEETFSEKVPPTEGQGIPAYVDVETASTAVRPAQPSPTPRTARFPPALPPPRAAQGEDVVLTPRLPTWVWVVPALIISAVLAYLAYRVSRPVEVAPPPLTEKTLPPAPEPAARPAPPGKTPAHRPHRPPAPSARAPILQ
jgi:hypothetical protein